MQRDKQIREARPQRSGHVLASDGVHQLNLIHMEADRVSSSSV